MKAGTAGVQWSLLVHGFFFATVWVLSTAVVIVSRPIEIDFSIVKEEAPRPSEHLRQYPYEQKKHRIKAAPRHHQPQVIEQQFTPSVSEEAAPVASLKPAPVPATQPVPSGGYASSAAKGTAEDAEFGRGGGPSFVHREMPVYPLAARRMHKEGKVLLRLTIDERGSLLHTEVVEGAEFGFTEAALEAVRKSTYRPALRDGIAVRSRALLPVKFVLAK